MSKKQNKQNKNQQQSLSKLLLAGLLLVVVAVGIFVVTRPPASVSQKISPAQYQQQFGRANPATYVLLDVRTPEEFSSGYIKGAINISVETLKDRLKEVPRDKTVVVYCRSGNRSATAAGILNKAGYTPVYDLGGIQAWSAAGLPVVQ